MIQTIGIPGFKSDLRKFVEQVGLAEETVVKKVALEAFTRIVQKTPIDTGRAMNNWVISIGQVVYRVTQKGGSAGELQSKKAAEAQAALSGYKRGQVVWITNTVEYITFLNEGSSKQAPSQFVQDAVREAALTVRLP